MRKKSLFLAIVSLLVLPACAPATPTPTATPRPTATAAPTPTAETAPLIGTNWTLSAYGPAASPTPAAVDLNTSLILHPDGGWNADMGCNYMEGDYSVQSDKLTFEKYIYTLMLCDEERMRQEMVFAQTFQGRVQVTFILDGGMLTVTSADGNTVMIFKKRVRQ